MTSALPPPSDLAGTPRDLLAELARHVGEPTAVKACAALLRGADAADRAAVLPYLGGRPAVELLGGSPGWAPYWCRVWGARGLLYVWSESVSADVLTGLGDGHWRVAEMCLKVSARRELPVADDGVRLASHELPRVRAAALRALGVAGDAEHVDAVEAGLQDPEEQVRRAAARALERLETRLDLPGRL